MKTFIGIITGRFLFLLLLMLPTWSLHAQINIQFTPALNGQTVNGLFMAQIQNTSAYLYTGKLKITVRDGSNKIVLVAQSPLMHVSSGVMLLQSISAQCRVQFGNSPTANLIAQTGRFPENDYEYCFEFTGTENKPFSDERVFENCFNYSVQPIIPMSLIYPGDGDKLCNKRPEFNWQPAMPLVSSYRYRILVTEKKDRQLAADAVMNNIPVIQQDNIAGFMLMYPPQAPDLQTDKQYVWQVTAYEGNTKITQSEIWVFSINCDDKKPDSSKDSYRQLSGILTGNYYVATDMLRFAAQNPYGATTMKYSITSLSGATEKITNLPQIKLRTGLNNIDMDLTDIKGLEINKMYLLTIKNIGDHVLYLQFIYKGSN
ncbi:MAG: hypothetical protein QM726_17755 [Chitinophagaceae bacterium]